MIVNGPIEKVGLIAVTKTLICYLEINNNNEINTECEAG